MGCSVCALGTYSGSRVQKSYYWTYFLRYISAAFDKRYKELVEDGDGFEDDIDAYTMEHTSDVDNVMEIIEQSYRMQAE